MWDSYRALESSRIDSLIKHNEWTFSSLESMIANRLSIHASYLDHVYHPFQSRSETWILLTADHPNLNPVSSFHEFQQHGRY